MSNVSTSRLALAAVALAIAAAPAQAQNAPSTEGSIRIANPYAAPEGGQFARGMASGDFDGNGIMDIAVMESGADRVRIYRGVAWTVGQSGPVIRFLAATVASPFANAVLAAGDFDGDGRDELALGAQGTGFSGMPSVGAVYVLDRSAGGIWSVQSEIRLGQFGYGGAPSNGDNLGNALAVANFDGDAYEDLAIGIRGKTVAGQLNAGRVLVALGSPTGIVAAGHRFFDRESQLLAGQPTMDDFFGWSLAGGDFDGDGYGDLAIGIRGAHCNPDGSGPRGGGVAVLRGTPNGPTEVLSQFLAPGHAGTPGTCSTSGPDSVYGFGIALAAGVSAPLDPYADLLVGAPTGAGGGAVMALFGSDGGLSGASGSIVRASQMPVPVASGARFGNVVRIAPLFGGLFPGFAAVIGAPQDTVDGIDNAGSVWIVRFAGGGLDAGRTQRWTANAGLAIGPAQTNDQFGSAIVTGDFNDDSRVDLAIGAYLDDEAGTDAGAFQVIYSSGFIFRNGFQ